MSDSENRAIFKILEHLQKEINDLKNEDDGHYLAIEDLVKHETCEAKYKHGRWL